ncbi:hypothetical protein PRNP1_008452 [Phytophthora ramorum]
MNPEPLVPFGANCELNRHGLPRRDLAPAESSPPRTFETQQELLELNLVLLEFQAAFKLPNSFMENLSTILLFRSLNPALPAALVKIRRSRARFKQDGESNAICIPQKYG